MQPNTTRVGARGVPSSSLVALLVIGVLAGCALPAAGRPTPSTGDRTSVETAGSAIQSPVANSSRSEISYPADGDNRWEIATGEDPAGGDGRGRLLRYSVAVERDIRGLSAVEFATEVTQTLSDPQGWTAGGALRLRRVGPGEWPDFTIYLATPGTRDELCQDVPDGYTSCRNGDRVVLNVARWMKGVPDYGASLATYRQYLVNHEVGHRLGMGHEMCPGLGRPAPVMQQQTLGLHGCTANALPYLDGKRYTGPPGEYDDSIPPREQGSPG